MTNDEEQYFLDIRAIEENIADDEGNYGPLTEPQWRQFLARITKLREGGYLITHHMIEQASQHVRQGTQQ